MAETLFNGTLESDGDVLPIDGSEQDPSAPLTDDQIEDLYRDEIDAEPSVLTLEHIVAKIEAAQAFAAERGIRRLKIAGKTLPEFIATDAFHALTPAEYRELVARYLPSTDNNGETINTPSPNPTVSGMGSSAVQPVIRRPYNYEEGESPYGDLGGGVR